MPNYASISRRTIIGFLTVSLLATSSVVVSAPPAHAGLPGQAYAQQLINSGKVTGWAEPMAQLTAWASGTARVVNGRTCNLDGVLLAALSQVVVNGGYSIAISSLNRYCTGETTNTTKSHGAGKAVDIYKVNGVISTGNTADDRALVLYFASAISTPAKIGQSNCRAASPLTLPAGVTQASDECNHDHLEYLGSASAPMGSTNAVLAPGDWDGDGFNDVLHLQPAGLYLYRGNGTGGFINGAGIVLATNWWGLKVITPGDWDGDSHPDLMAIDGSGNLWLYRGNGVGGFASTNGTLLSTNWGGLEHVVAPGDWDGDGHPDLVVVDSGGGLWLYRGNGSGGFASANATLLATNWGGYRQLATPGDFNNDGHPDLLLADSAGKLWLYRGNGVGGFVGNSGLLVDSSWIVREVVGTPNFNGGSGASDVFSVTNAGTMYLYAGSGSGTFSSWTSLGTGW